MNDNRRDNDNLLVTSVIIACFFVLAVSLTGVVAKMCWSYIFSQYSPKQNFHRFPFLALFFDWSYIARTTLPVAGRTLLAATDRAIAHSAESDALMWTDSGMNLVIVSAFAVVTILTHV